MKANALSDFASDIKRPLVHDEEDGEIVICDPRSRARPLAIGFAAVALCFFLLSHLRPTFWLKGFGSHMKGSEATWRPIASTRELVPFEAHIMSKCPDARDCFRDMVLPTMQRVYDKVNFTLSYIGSPSESDGVVYLTHFYIDEPLTLRSPTENDGVACMHGPEECMGNIVELCAANLYPDPKIYLGFTNCLFHDYQDIPQHDLMADCALEHGIDLAKLEECAVRDDGAFGVGLLRDSVRRSTDAGVTKSCTLRVNEEKYCIRDGGEWKDCPSGPGVNDLVIAIEKLYRS